MTGLIFGLITCAAVIGFAEIFKKAIDLSFYASLNLAVIPFIYVGFSIDPHSLMLTVPGAAFFLVFAYLGYKKHYLLTVVGLALHGLWDVLFPHASPIVPHGYDIFCITIDFLLAAYFYLRLRPRKQRTYKDLEENWGNF